MQRVLVGISGGMDSAVAVKLLLDRGYAVEGAVLKMHSFTEVDAAKACADALGIPLHVVDCEERFSRTVISDFLEAYQRGETPNPCIVCNSKVKFRMLWETAQALGVEKIATGHYAGVHKVGERFAVFAAKDTAKDQSYMLYRLEQEILRDLILPLEEYRKESLRTEAGRISADLADRPESQEICFIQGERYTDYIERHVGAFSSGDFVDEEGRVLGKHRGIVHYTVGQRKGLGVSAPTRMFVKKIDVSTNRIILSAAKNAEEETFFLKNVVLQSAPDMPVGEELDVMLRYRSSLAKGRLLQIGDEYAVVVQAPRATVTPGQSAVLYRNGAIMLGGVISTEN